MEPKCCILCIDEFCCKILPLTTFCTKSWQGRRGRGANRRCPENQCSCSPSPIQSHLSMLCCSAQKRGQKILQVLPSGVNFWNTKQNPWCKHNSRQKEFSFSKTSKDIKLIINWLKAIWQHIQIWWIPNRRLHCTVKWHPFTDLCWSVLSDPYKSLHPATL